MSLLTCTAICETANRSSQATSWWWIHKARNSLGSSHSSIHKWPPLTFTPSTAAPCKMLLNKMNQSLKCFSSFLYSLPSAEAKTAHKINKKQKPNPLPWEERDGAAMNLVVCINPIIFVQCRPGWWGITEPWLVEGYTQLQQQTPSPLPVKGRLRALLLILDCKFHRDCIYSCPCSTQHDGAWLLIRQEARLRPSWHCLVSEAGKEPRSPAPSLLPIRPPSSHWAGNLGWASQKYFGAYLPVISRGFRYLDAFGGSGPKSKSPTGRLLEPCILQRQCWRVCYTMEENQDARQKEKAKEIKVRIKFFNTKKVCLSSSSSFF